MNDEDFYLDLALDVDDAHTARTEANNAPPALWQQIRAEYGSEKEDATMSMNLTLSSPAFAQPQAHNGRLQRFSGMIATLAIIGVLAFGGWFAAMNLPPANEGQQLAVIPATPTVTATCDVPSMTVDQVMGVVKNPMIYTWIGSAAPADVVAEEAALMRQEGRESRIVIPVRLDLGSRVAFSESEFALASEVANAYLTCIVNGTQGQVWSFYTPAALQMAMLSRFPVYATEEDVRTYVETQIDLPATQSDWQWGSLPFIDNVVSAKVNPDANLAIAKAGPFQLYEKVVFIGVVIETGEDGIIARTNGNGTNLIPNNNMITGRNDIILRVTLVKPFYSDTWGVVPSYSMDAIEAMGDLNGN